MYVCTECYDADHKLGFTGDTCEKCGKTCELPTSISFYRSGASTTIKNLRKLAKVSEQSKALNEAADRLEYLLDVNLASFIYAQKG